MHCPCYQSLLSLFYISNHWISLSLSLYICIYMMKFGRARGASQAGGKSLPFGHQHGNQRGSQKSHRSAHADVLPFWRPLGGRRRSMQHPDCKSTLTGDWSAERGRVASLGARSTETQLIRREKRRDSTKCRKQYWEEMRHTRDDAPIQGSVGTTADTRLTERPLKNVVVMTTGCLGTWQNVHEGGSAQERARV